MQVLCAIIVPLQYTSLSSHHLSLPLFLLISTFPSHLVHITHPHLSPSQHVAATLGSGNLKLAVQLPEGEDMNEWIAVNS